MINFYDWLVSRESSALTRSRNAFMWGVGVPRADFMSRSTPHPVVMDKIKKEIEPNLVPKKKKNKKNKKHRRKHK